MSGSGLMIGSNLPTDLELGEGTDVNIGGAVLVGATT